MIDEGHVHDLSDIGHSRGFPGVRPGFRGASAGLGTGPSTLTGANLIPADRPQPYWRRCSLVSCYALETFGATNSIFKLIKEASHRLRIRIRLREQALAAPI